MDELINKLNKLLASTYGISHKASFYHWNVVDPMFPVYHEFFGELYEEIYGSIDKLAEHIRQIDGVPLNSPSMLKQNSYLSEANDVIESRLMIRDLLEDAIAIKEDLVKIYNLAERFSEFGLSNFLQDRIEAFSKHIWMLKSMH